MILSFGLDAGAGVAGIKPFRMPCLDRETFSDRGRPVPPGRRRIFVRLSRHPFSLNYVLRCGSLNDVR